MYWPHDNSTFSNGAPPATLPDPPCSTGTATSCDKMLYTRKETRYTRLGSVQAGKSPTENGILVSEIKGLGLFCPNTAPEPRSRPAPGKVDWADADLDASALNASTPMSAAQRNFISQLQAD
ncbi:MAG: hypothetical protein ABI026_11655 [Gemmatimonadaceae bacterium]